MTATGNYSMNTSMMSSGNMFIDLMMAQVAASQRNQQNMYNIQQRTYAALSEILAKYPTVQNYNYNFTNYQVTQNYNNPFSNPIKISDTDAGLSANFYQGTGGAGTNRRVDTKCNKTAAELNKHLSGVLAGKGAVFLEAERRYGVNAAFLISVCKLESGNGKSGLARSQNNVAGIGGQGNFKTYNSVDDCIFALAKMISQGQYYFTQGKKTIAQIGPTYCDSSWAGKVSNIMNTIA